jgi:phenylacetate-CoA ligase
MELDQGGRSLISIIVPCLNEEGNVRSTFERISKALKEIDFEVIFVNDGSTDNTKKIISELIAMNPTQIRLVSHEKNLGIPRAWESGLSHAKFDLACLIDGDLQNPPEAIPQLLQVHLEQQADVTQGVRSSIGRLKNERFVFSRVLNILLNFCFNQSAKDSKSGFLVSNKRALLDVFQDISRFHHFQSFIGVSLRARGYRVVEAETLFLSREVGDSFLTVLKTIQVLISTFKDMTVGMRLYGRSVKLEQFGIQSEWKIDLSLIRRIRFELYFATMPLHKWIIGKRAKKLYFWLKSSEFASKLELERLQLHRIQKLLQHAYLNVPYYRRAFDAANFKPSDLRSLSDLLKVPMLTKKDVRENVHFSMFSNTHNKKMMHRISTSGSTGEPFICYADKFQLEMRFATTLRALEMTGWRFGDKQLRLWHQTLGMSKLQALKEKIDAWFMRRHFVPAFEMSQHSINKLIGVIERKQPVLIDGYAESLNFIAMASNRKSNYAPKAVMSSAQQLTDTTRRQIEEQFGSKVLDKYGSREFSGIAYQCLESTNHHVQDESYILEVLVDGRHANPGEIGEIVITDLNNFSMPLIRYRIGDLAIAVSQEECKCGRSHSTIGDIKGRTQALVYCANGVWLPGTFFAHFFKDFDFAVRHYQVIQEEKDYFAIRIVPTSQFSDEIENSIISELQNYTGTNQLIKLIIVNEIPLLATGKRTPVISKIALDFQDIDASRIWAR